MNFQSWPVLEPLKVLIVNPLLPASRLLAPKILSGKIFGNNQMIDLTLLVYSIDIELAEVLRTELENCAFSCINIIKVTTDVPSISDADVFCFMTNLTNPNQFDAQASVSAEIFDTLYLLLKIASSLNGSWQKKNEIRFVKGIMRSDVKMKQPIFVADGLVALDILNTCMKDVPSNLFFCSTPITAIARMSLAEYLKVQCDKLNDVLVWAINDEVFHVEFEKPYLVQDKIKLEDDLVNCDIPAVKKNTTVKHKVDHRKFTPSWMKKEFISKVKAIAVKNPYGCIYKANGFAKTLKTVWKTRTCGSEEKLCCNLGIISDGSLQTIPGYPYVLPLMFNSGTWSIDKRFEEDIHLKNEIKRMNKALKNQHDKLIPYCKKFLEENILKKDVISALED